MKKDHNKETMKIEKGRDFKKSKRVKDRPDFDTILKTAQSMAEIIKEQDLSEFSLEYAGAKIKMFRDDEQSGQGGYPMSAVPFSAPHYPAPISADAINVEKSRDAEFKDSETGYELANQVLSPMAGTFYSAPSPDSAPFVEINQKVSKGDVLCILEAMKLMNEFKSEKSGTIKKIFKENAETVTEGDKLFIIE